MMALIMAEGSSRREHESAVRQRADAEHSRRIIGRVDRPVILLPRRAVASYEVSRASPLGLPLAVGIGKNGQCLPTDRSGRKPDANLEGVLDRVAYVEVDLPFAPRP